MSVPLDAAASRMPRLPQYDPLKVLALFLPAFLFLPSLLLSQPILNFKRVTVNWPTIELYFAVDCDGIPAYNMTKQNFRVTENGEEIKDFTFWCPDPDVRCAVSVALVADVSGSLAGTGLEEEKRDMRAFIDLLDNNVDEVTILSAGSDVRIRQTMTQINSLLYRAIDSLDASGGSALYDGIMEGLRELIRNGVNQCRALIVFTDGGDITSAATLQDIIALANRNRIRVFTVGVGSVIDPASLEMLALLTGGRYYQNPNSASLAAIYQEMSAIIFPVYLEPIITYERGCADGSMRTVELQLENFCGGNDSKTKTYLAPLDPTTFAEQRMEIQKKESLYGQLTTVTLSLGNTVIPNKTVIYPFDITIHSGSPRRGLTAANIPASSPLFGTSASIALYSDSLRLHLDEKVVAGQDGPLLEMQFQTLGVNDSVWYPLYASVRDIGPQCAITVVDSGGYRIVWRLLPRITPAGEIWLCRDAEITLQANDGFAAYRWSTGDTTRSVRVSTEGAYYVAVVEASGDTLRSAPVSVRVRPERKVWLEPTGPLSFCHSSSVTFHVAGDTAGTQIFWKNQTTPHNALQSNATELVWATVVDEFGCVSHTDTLATEEMNPPLTLSIPETNLFVCAGDSVEVAVLEDYPAYFWETGPYLIDSTRSIFARPSGGPMKNGGYAVRVRDANGCLSSWHTFTVSAYPARPVSFTPSTRIVLCPGGEAQVSVKEEFTGYAWSTGDTSRTLTVRSPGALTVDATSDAGCVSHSETLRVEMVDAPHPRITPTRYATLCPDDSLLLEAEEGYAAYRWSTGDTTRTIRIADAGPYHVDAMAYGGCWGRSDTITVQKEMETSPQIGLEGYPLLCAGDSMTLEAPEGYARYRWSTRDTTRTITVHAAGWYYFMVLSAGGCEGVSNILYIQERFPETPTIRKDGLELSTTTKVLSHQWFLDGQPLADATGPTLDITQTGSYRVQVVDSCGAVLMSEELLVTTLGIAADPREFRLDVYPDPSDGVVHVEMRGVNGQVQAVVMDLLGRSVVARRWTPGTDGAIREILDFHSVPRGLYVLRLTSPEGVLFRRLVKQ